MDGDASKPIGTRNAQHFRKAKRAAGTVRHEVYLPAYLAEAIDDFRQVCRISTRPEAIRRLCEVGLKAGALLRAVHDLGALVGPERPAASPAGEPEASTRGGRQ